MSVALAFLLGAVFLLLPIVLAAAAWMRSNRYSGRIELLENTLHKLALRVVSLESRQDAAAPATPAAAATAPPPVAAPVSTPIPEPAPAPVATPVAAPVAAPVPAPVPVPVAARVTAHPETPAGERAPQPVAASVAAPVSPPFDPGAGRSRFEQMLAERWTGILGVTVLVAGVTFIAIYAALHLTPFLRFLMTLAVAGALLGAGVALGRRPEWGALGSWLRSAGAAVLLFACAASGGLPGLGLQWLQAPVPALALLIAGITANLAMAWFGGSQVQASLHVVLAMVPLAIAPAGPASLVIASVVAAFGVARGARGRWEEHLAVVLGAYILFHLIWSARMAEVLAGGGSVLAAICASSVFVLAASVHHRRESASTSVPPLPLAVYLVSWLCIAGILFVYVPNPWARDATLGAGALMCALLARRARRFGIDWLYRADVLTAQALVLLAVTRFGPRGLALFAFAETLLFRIILRRTSDAVLERVACALPPLAGTVLGVLALLDLEMNPALGPRVTAELFVGVALAVAGQWVMRTPRDGADASGRNSPSATSGLLLGVLAGALALLALVPLVPRPSLGLVGFAAVGALAVLRRVSRHLGLDWGVTLALLGIHFMGFGAIVSLHSLAPGILSPRLLPLYPLTLLVAITLPGGDLRRIALVLLGLDLAAGAYLYLDPISPLLPGVAWLMLSLLALEAANRANARDAATLVALGYLDLAAFAVDYGLVVIQSPAYVGVVRARLLIELFALAVMGYWLLFRPRGALGEVRHWHAFQPRLLEAGLLFAATIVLVECPAQYCAVAWGALGLLLLAPAVERTFDARVRFYSLLFHWLSVADLVVVLSGLRLPSSAWYDRIGFTALLAIAIQIFYAVRSHRGLVLTGLDLPRRAWLIGRFAATLQRRRNWAVYYPLFLGVALFLRWRFDHSVLTLLWVVESFGVLVLSVVLREPPFRRVALIGAGASLVRLVLIDLSETNLGVRGVVFIGVGLLMLGMNAVYNRFRARFEA